MRNGVVNAGLLDQHFALQWVQHYIGLFGGDASKVTISGQSSGGRRAASFPERFLQSWLIKRLIAGGSVMLQTMAFGGSLGESLFSNAIAASPFLPQQYGYKDFVPSQSYYAFASAAGCFGPPAPPFNNFNKSIFACLVSKDTATLQYASASVSGSSRYGTWAFLPVTDGVFVQQLPSQQLLKKQVNGKSILVGVGHHFPCKKLVAKLLKNNANEGPAFTPQNIITEDDFVNFLRNTFPLFSNENIAQILYHYPSTNASVSKNTPKFATSGNSTPTAVNESTFGTGQQQRADVCLALLLPINRRHCTTRIP